jgi:hypothetical protein
VVADLRDAHLRRQTMNAGSPPQAEPTGRGSAMAYDRQQVIDSLRSLGYTQAADEAARVLLDPVSLDQFWAFADQYQISGDELVSRMGGGP